MALVEAVRVLDEAEYVQTYNDSHFRTFIQVWHGGTQVRVFTPRSKGEWEELTVWTISTEKGKPVDQEKIAEHMDMHAQSMVEEALGQ